MSNMGNKYKVGVFTVVAFSILILGLVSLGTLKYFRTTYQFMTAVKSSVQGLEKGAKVKVKGVTIGSVEKIQLGPEMKLAYIYMKFDPEAFSRIATPKYSLMGFTASEKHAFFGKRLSQCVEEGLRCKLEYGDITGTLFVDIMFFDPKEYPPIDIELPADSPPYIPSVPTATIGSIITQTNKITNNLAQVDFKELSDDLKSFIGKSNKILDEDQFAKIIDQVQSISENLDKLSARMNEVLDKKKLEEMTDNVQKTFANINSTLDSIEKLSEEIRTEVRDSKVPETAERARSLMESSEKTLRTLDSLKADLRRSLEEFNATLQTTRDLIDYLEKNPSSVIRGKAERPVVEPE